jgi:hypothetical protein
VGCRPTVGWDEVRLDGVGWGWGGVEKFVVLEIELEVGFQGKWVGKDK